MRTHHLADATTLSPLSNRAVFTLVTWDECTVSYTREVHGCGWGAMQTNDDDAFGTRVPALDQARTATRARSDRTGVARALTWRGRRQVSR